MKITNHHDRLTIVSTAALLCVATMMAWVDHRPISTLLLLWPLMIWGMDRASR